MANLEVEGKISHYAHDGEVRFSFIKIAPQKENDLPMSVYDFDLLFEIYKKFKNSNIKITVEKMEA